MAKRLRPATAGAAADGHEAAPPDWRRLRFGGRRGMGDAGADDRAVVVNDFEN
jgi:hypothetical protein